MNKNLNQAILDQVETHMKRLHGILSDKESLEQLAKHPDGVIAQSLCDSLEYHTNLLKSVRVQDD